MGQEEQNEIGLNWLTFRHRNYMPEIGRFFGVDPISDDYYSISPYQFAHNNPIWKVEIEGLEGKIPNPNSKDVISDEKKAPPMIRALRSPAVKETANLGTREAKGIFTGSIKVKPKLGLGISGSGQLGPLKAGAEANVITLSAGAKFKDGELTGNIDTKLISGGIELSAAGNDFEATGSMLNLGVEGSFDENGVNVTDSSVEKPTGRIDINGAQTNSNGDLLAVGGKVKLLKAIEIEAKISIDKVVTTIASPFIKLATFARETFKENVKDGLNQISTNN